MVVETPLEKYLKRIAPSLIVGGLGMIIIGIATYMFPKSHPGSHAVLAIAFFAFGVFTVGWGTLVLMRNRVPKS
jgi:hypothetical protein